MAHREPGTIDEWKDAMILAAAHLQIHAAIAYGFITGPEIDVDRCEDLLERGRQLPGLEHWPPRHIVEEAVLTIAVGEVHPG